MVGGDSGLPDILRDSVPFWGSKIARNMPLFWRDQTPRIFTFYVIFITKFSVAKKSLWKQYLNILILSEKKFVRFNKVQKRQKNARNARQKVARQLPSGFGNRQIWAFWRLKSHLAIPTWTSLVRDVNKQSGWAWAAAVQQDLLNFAEKIKPELPEIGWCLIFFNSLEHWIEFWNFYLIILLC